MIKKIYIGFVFISLLAACSNNKVANKPNIIVIMVDDMGFSDPGCYGGEINTPNIDKLAENGIRFTNFHNTSRCSPTRASLLTGQYPHKVGLHRNGRSLSQNALTMAEVLKMKGYQTGMIGKWHLSKSFTLDNDPEKHQKWLDHQIDPDVPFGPLETYPVNRGFEKHYGVIWGVVDFFDPFSLVNGLEAVKEVDDDFYITKALNDSAVAYIDHFTSNGNPFFLYIAHTAPHWPLHALDEDIEKYKGVFDKGWDQMRRDRYERQLNMGLFDKKNTPLPENMGRRWEDLSIAEKDFQISKMKAHAAMIHRVDIGVGKLIDKLTALNQLDNTIIFFLSDNGASPEIMVKPGYDRSSMTREGEKIRYEKDGFEYAGPQTTYGGIGREWANAANTPFRFWKAESFEGGNNTPCIIHWPSQLKVTKGAIIEDKAHVMDILPTILDITGIKYPQEYQGIKITALDGKSLLPVLNGAERKGHEYIFFEHVTGRAVIKDNWKLVSKIKKQNRFNEFSEWELYDLSKDRTETNDVISQYPEIAEDLKIRWNEWFKDYVDLR